MLRTAAAQGETGTDFTEMSDLKRIVSGLKREMRASVQLKSMGIYELPLPNALQGYQAGLDLDE